MTLTHRIMRLHQLAIAFVITPLTLVAQAKPGTALTWADSVRAAIEAAQINADPAAMRAAHAVVERALVAFPGDALLLHYDGYARYREAAQALGRGDRASAGPLLEQGTAALEASAKKRPMPETSALLATMYGQQIGLDQSKAMTLGMLLMQIMGDAASAGPQNPRVALLQGVNTLYTPAQYGGGVQPALEHLQRAVTLFEKDHPAPGMPAWGRAEVHAWLGRAYTQAGDTAQAVVEYRKALAIEPNYAFVKGLLAATKK